jgi:hypothetical protein
LGENCVVNAIWEGSWNDGMREKRRKNKKNSKRVDQVHVKGKKAT